MKIAGFVMIFSFCAAGGFLMGNRVVKRSEMIKSFLDFFNYIIDNLKNYGYSIEKIFILYKNETLEKTGFLTELIKSGKRNGVYKNTWNETIASMLEESGEFYVLREEELGIIRAFGENLGKTNLETQLKSCETSRENLSKFYKEKEGEFKQKAKLYRISGGLIGMFVCVMLL